MMHTHANMKNVASDCAQRENPAAEWDCVVYATRRRILCCIVRKQSPINGRDWDISYFHKKIIKKIDFSHKFYSFLCEWITCYT